MKRVQHDEVKPDMVIKLANHGPRGRWATIEHVYGLKTLGSSSETYAEVRAFYTNAQDRKRFVVLLYASPEGYQLHPQSELLAAQAHQRKGRADFVENVVLREYSIKFVIVDRVDNQGVACGYCMQHGITANIYAKLSRDNGAVEENNWSSCSSCILPSIDQVEDVDPAYTITIERVQ